MSLRILLAIGQALCPQVKLLDAFGLQSLPQHLATRFASAEEPRTQHSRHAQVALAAKARTSVHVERLGRRRVLHRVLVGRVGEADRG